jgi:spore coat polysaccharide biosynthesis predicted glycosyltransferase SpsG
LAPNLDNPHLWNLSDNNTQTLINTVVSNAVDLLVFDHYDIGYQFEKTINIFYQVFIIYMILYH